MSACNGSVSVKFHLVLATASSYTYQLVKCGITKYRDVSSIVRFQNTCTLLSFCVQMFCITDCKCGIIFCTFIVDYNSHASDSRLNRRKRMFSWKRDRGLPLSQWVTVNYPAMFITPNGSTLKSKITRSAAVAENSDRTVAYSRSPAKVSKWT